MDCRAFLAHRVKRALRLIVHAPQYAIALLIYVCLPVYRRRLLGIEQSSRADRYWHRYLLSVWQRLVFERADPDTQERLKLQLIGGEAGLRWARMYAARSFEDELNGRVGTLSFRDARPIFPTLERLCADGQSWTVLQIGSSSGRELAYYAAHYPTTTFVGVDFVPKVVAFANSVHRAPNLRFLVADATRLDTIAGEVQSPIIVLSNGVLQYIGPTKIGLWFHALAAWRAVHHVLLNECVVLTQGALDARHRSSYNRSSWSATHNYRWFAERAGWRTARSEFIYPFMPPEAYSEQGDTAVSFYHGIR